MKTGSNARLHRSNQPRRRIVLIGVVVALIAVSFVPGLSAARTGDVYAGSHWENAENVEAPGCTSALTANQTHSTG